ncbi:MAG: ATP-binding cassette domain-containing protein, partial [Elusimicrobiales bacterium]|nr:ATP-binding cassette domain-containing protein [Elusimicrobiales bacterium]
MKLEIADFTFKFKSEQKKVLGILEKRYKKFFIGSKAEFFFEINFLKKPSLPFRPSIIFKEKKLIIKRGDFYCVLDIKNKKGSLEISPKVQSFDSFLRVLCSWLLINKTGFLLHCAGAIMNNKGCLFVGKSGAGKSTLLNMITGVDQLSSGEILVRANGSTVNLTDLSENELTLWRGRTMGVIYQSFQLLPMLNLVQNV